MIQNLKKSIYRIFNFRSKENNKIIEDLNNNLTHCAIYKITIIVIL